MKVVGWYLPEHVDEALDMRRMTSGHRPGLRRVRCRHRIPAQRGRSGPQRHPQSERSRRSGPGIPNLALAAIPVAPIVWERLNATWWPNFPYRELAAVLRRVDAPELLDLSASRSPVCGMPTRYNVENIEMLRDSHRGSMAAGSPDRW